jgi:hypothetical protein
MSHSLSWRVEPRDRVICARSRLGKLKGNAYGRDLHPP